MKAILLLCLISLISNSVFAQDAKDSGSGGDAVDELVNDSYDDLVVVLGSGLAGAVLGLSTLSFVEEPSDHYKNILTGASLGIIAGVIYVAYVQATKTKEMGMSGAEVSFATPDFNTSARNAWHDVESLGYHQEHIDTFKLNFMF